MEAIKKIITGENEEELTNIEYGSLLFDSKEYVLRGYDGSKWVTKEETRDEWLRNLIESFEIYRPQ
jgi:hypothetical protein